MYIPAPSNINVPTNVSTSNTPLPTTIYYLGLVSLLTDISSEMVSSILPVFLYSVLHLPALQVAFIDGLYQSAAALVRLLAAHWAERWQRIKLIAVYGYGLSLIAKLLLWFSLSYGFIAVLFSLLLDRLGKGIRTAPRDTLIANQVSTTQLGKAFGVHRTMDAFGALIGPFLASGFLAYYAERYDILFLISAIFALFGLLTLIFKVPKHHSKPTDNIPNTPAVVTDLKNTEGNLSTVSHLSFWQRVMVLGKQTSFMRLALIAVLLNLFTLSDGLLYLSVQQQLKMPEHTVALMFGVAACSFMLSAYFFGKKADNQGIGILFSWAYGGLLILYVAWTVFLYCAKQGIVVEFSANPLSEYNGYIIAMIITLSIGLFYGATDGILVAGLAKECPREYLTSGLALYTTLLSLAKLLSSLVYGWLWQTYNTVTAFACFTIGLAICALVALYVWNKQPTNNTQL
jgi:MFS family permease